MLPCRHLAAAEGCYSVVEWLLTEGKCLPNPIDRFKRTPLEVCHPVWTEFSNTTQNITPRLGPSTSVARQLGAM